jgi:hypothetical protein
MAADLGLYLNSINTTKKNVISEFNIRNSEIASAWALHGSAL